MALNVAFGHQTKRVRVTPGMTMFQVVEQACEHFGLPNAAQFELTHRQRPVDLATPFRLTGISNNAALELQRRAGGATGSDLVDGGVVEHAAASVRVAVQLLDGRRRIEAFPSDRTLEAILHSLKLLPAHEEFSLNFLQREIPYTALATTTLQDLGVVQGSAMFRMQRSATNTATQPPPPPTPGRSITVAVSGEPPLPLAPQPRQKSEAKSTAATPSAPVQSPPTPSIGQCDIEMAAESKEASSGMSAPPRMSGYDALQRLRGSCFDVVSRAAVMTLMKILTNILSHPDNEKMRAIRLANPAFERNVGQHPGGIEFLLSVGFEFDGEQQVLGLLSPDKAKLNEGLRLLANEADELMIEETARPKVVVPVAADPTFDAFKPQITRMAMQPRGPSATEVLVDNLKARQEQLLRSVEKPSRNTKVTFPGQPTSTIVQSDILSEDEPSDAALVIASMKARRAEMEKAQNFRTQAMRELDELKRKKVFQSTLIRVQFPDRVTLQAAFHPNERIVDVIDHVRGCLDVSSDQQPFYLYVSPPRQKLDPEGSLSDLGLVPAAHVYLSWMSSIPTAETPGWYLRQDFLTSELAESKQDEDLLYPSPIALDESAVKKAAVSAAGEAAAKRAGGEAKGKPGKKPSWLKL